MNSLLYRLACRCVSITGRHRQQLEPESLIAVYRAGRFPFTENYGRLVWQDPEQRAIVPLDDRFRIPEKFRRFINVERFRITFNTAFDAVIAECAATTETRPSSWITPEIRDAYARLHRIGVAHSVEAWQDGALVGGGYGVAIGGAFSGESMFTRVSNAGKVAFVHQVRRLQARGFTLYDTQELSGLTEQFGAYVVDRAEYHERLAHALTVDASFADGPAPHP